MLYTIFERSLLWQKNWWYNKIDPIKYRNQKQKLEMAIAKKKDTLSDHNSFAFLTPY